MLKFITQFFTKISHNVVARNGILFSFFSFLNNGISFFLLLIIAGFISPEGYGELNLFTTLIVLLSFLISLNTTGILSVDFFNLPKSEMAKMVNVVLFISTGMFLILFIFLLFFSSFLEIKIGLSSYYQLIALLICYFQVFSAVNLDFFRLEEKVIQYGIYSVSATVLNFVLTILFVVYWDADWEGRVYAQLGVCVCFFFISICLMVGKKYLCIRETFNKLYLKNALSFGVPLIPHSMSFWFRQGLDRYIINNFYSVSAVGIFSFSYNFANIIQTVGVAFNATNSVFIYKEISKGAGARCILKKQTKIMLVFFLLFSLCIYLAASIFIPILLPKYTDSIKYLFPLCLSSFFQCMYLLFVNYLFFFKKTKKLMYITFSLSILHALLSLWLTQYSMMYTAYVGLITNLLIALSVFIYSRRVYKVI